MRARSFRHVTARRHTIVAALLLVFAHGRLFAQDAGGEWSDLRRQAGSRTVTVHTTSGDRAQGAIISVDATTLVLDDTPRRFFMRAEVCRVTVGGERGLRRVVAIGGLALAGYLIGRLVSGLTADDPHEWVGGVVGAGLGAAAGAVVPIGAERTLYQSASC